MAALTQILQAVQTVTTATNGTSYDISNTPFTKGQGSVDWTVILEVRHLDDAGVIARFSLQDSVDAFTTPVAGPTVEVTGRDDVQFPRIFTWTHKDWPGVRFGVANAAMRLSLTLITGVLPHATFAVYYQGPFSN